MIVGRVTPDFPSGQRRRGRLVRHLSALAAILAGLSSLPVAGQAQDAQPTAEVIKDWTLRCATPQGAPAEQCILVQDINNPQSQQPIMQVAAGYWGPDRSRGLVITLPLGVILPQGVELQVDGQSKSRTPFVSCTPNGCQSHVLLSDELLTQLKSGNRGTIIFTDPRGRPEQVNFSLSGFTAGMARIK